MRWLWGGASLPVRVSCNFLPHHDDDHPGRRQGMFLHTSDVNADENSGLFIPQKTYYADQTTIHHCWLLQSKTTTTENKAVDEVCSLYQPRISPSSLPIVGAWLLRCMLACLLLLSVRKKKKRYICRTWASQLKSRALRSPSCRRAPYSIHGPAFIRRARGRSV